MANIRGRVLEAQQPGAQYAYLYGFRIDSPELQPEHTRWLHENIVSDALQPSTPTMTWHVWLSGTASRTGSWVHNLQLSEKRAENVAKFLQTRITTKGRLELHKGWSGELIGVLRGRANDAEHPLDRSVIIALKVLQPQPVPVTAPRPLKPDPYWYNPCCQARQLIDYYEVLLEVYSMQLARGKGGSLPRQSFQGDPHGPADVPRESLDSVDQHWVVTRLKAKGWSEERARELSKDSDFTVIRIDGLADKVNQLGRDIEYEKTLLGRCSPHDHTDTCAKGRLRKH
jgi:hypothetical protein